jgi:hypothetical protein
MFLSRPSDVGHWRDKGVSLFLLASDASFLRLGARMLRTDAGL